MVVVFDKMALLQPVEGGLVGMFPLGAKVVNEATADGTFGKGVEATALIIVFLYGFRKGNECYGVFIFLFGNEALGDLGCRFNNEGFRLYNESFEQFGVFRSTFGFVVELSHEGPPFFDVPYILRSRA
ncbi:hypothetical protein SDC9_132411 [bioreactor metagenome]|uniref:Uncharacterized protein n=1 Tax=bioreactor metagenome TaxID=1076179 RepID=A0A645D8Q7_9ZZZZ